MNRFPKLAAFAAVVTLLAGSSALAQSWQPNRPVTIVVPTSSSSGSDIIARAMSPRLQAIWKQPVVVDNKLGASGSIGFAAVARAAPDGYTILFGPNTITMLGALYKNVSWDAEQSYDPIALLARTTLAFVVNADVPAKNVNEFIALAKSKSGQLNYVTPGIGTPQHLAGELFKQVVGVDILHVPYKTLAAAITDLAGGRGQMGVVGLSSVIPMVKAGKIRVLATHGDQRANATPDVPTFKELGLEKVSADSYLVAMLPKGTPRDVADRIVRDILAVMAQPDYQQELVRADLIPNTTGGGPRELANTIKTDVAHWRQVVTNGNISGE